MRSRVFAAPPHQVDDTLTALSTQRDEDILASPASANREHDLEYALDFQGRKQLDSEDSSEVYTFGLQADVSNGYQGFPMPGVASANMLRNYLLKHLQPQQIVNEYGKQCHLFDISTDHLAVLQAKMWTKVSSARSPSQKTAQSPSRAQVSVSSHVTKISQLLKEKRIFVLSNAEPDTCQYLEGLQIVATHRCHSQIVRIEPLIHWGTVTHATASQSILLFRRDGELMQQPEYMHLVRRMYDAKAQIYCVDCLGYLWSKRAEARDTMRQLQRAVPGPQSRGSEEVVRSQIRLKLKSPGFTSADASALVIGGTPGLAAYHTKPTEAKLHKDFGKALPQFDGASVRLETARIRHASGNSQNDHEIWMSYDSDELSKDLIERARSVACRDAYTLPLHTTPTTPKSSAGHSTPFVPSSPSRVQPSAAITSPTEGESAANGRLRNKDVATEVKRDFHVIDLTTPPRIKRRKFGRELNTNTKVPFEVRGSPRKHSMKVPMSQENLVQPVRSMKPLKAPQERNKWTKDLIEKKKKRKTAPLIEQTSKQKIARTTALKELTVSRSDFQVNSTMEFQRTSKPESMARSLSPPNLTLHYAKRPANVEVPEGIATSAYEAFHNMHPTSTAKICWCNKPAGHGIFKKNEQPQIAQCTNLDCRNQWYHYACLNQSDKGKARFGNLFCQHCRNEQDFAEQDRKNCWSVEQLMDFKMEWSKEDIEIHMPGVGGHVSSANPYGLGIEIDLGPMYKTETRTRGTLGMLEGFGYAQSHPYMLEEAYINHNAYAGLTTKLAKDETDSDEWWYETQAIEVAQDDTEDVLDVEKEEGL